MITDELCVRGIKVVHILDAKHTVVHPMTAPSRVVKGAQYLPTSIPICPQKPALVTDRNGSRPAV